MFGDSHQFLYGSTISSSFPIQTRGFTSGAAEWLPGMAKVSRDEDNCVLVEVGPYPRATLKLNQAQVRQLAGKLLAALEDWPR